MTKISPFVSREASLNKRIEDQTAAIRSAVPLELPGPGAAIVQSYVEKIEGTYNVERAKTDTDNAIDLLYIAYNTTPQEEAQIRVEIAKIMDGLIKAQQESEHVMNHAMITADNILALLKRTLPDWRDCKEANDADEIKKFAAEELIALANEIKDRATNVKNELLAIATTYTGIIDETKKATDKSERALGDRLTNKAKLEKEIASANAERERIDALVKDLQEEVQKFDKKARDYESRANTAEQRAFLMQIVQVGAQVLSSAVPAIAMASTGGASVIAGSALSTVSKAFSDKPEEAKTPSDSKESTADVIEAKKEISEKKKELAASEKKVKELKEKTANLRKDIKKELPKKDSEASKSSEKASADEDAEKPEDTVAVKAIKSRLRDTKEELATEEEKSKDLVASLAGLQTSLSALDKGLGKLSAEQKDQATSLREMQMKMLDKVEAYEKERRTQSSELIKINALLKGQRTEQETIHLAIQSLNVSISALKRTKEIIVEIAFFFQSFADFIDQVSLEAAVEVQLLEKAIAKEKLRKYALESLISSIDEFFIKQAGKWNAARIVSDKFHLSFADGWSKLNKLSGKYITGNELIAYFQTASLKLEAIAAEREAAADEKIVALDKYRGELREASVRGGVDAA